jgi:hypothetical protein
MWRVKLRHVRGAPAWVESFKVGKTLRRERMSRKACQAPGSDGVATGSNRCGKAPGNARHSPEQYRERA